MNKRQQSKQNTNRNRTRHENLLATIQQEFTPVDVIYQDTYAVQILGRSSVCRFRLKETPDWEYGIWLFDDSHSLFGEHTELIDKFKPSRTYVSMEADMDSFLSKIRSIAEDPKFHFVNSLTHGTAEIDFEEIRHGNEVYYDGYQVIREFNEATGRFDRITRDEAITQSAYVEQEYAKYHEEQEQRRVAEQTERSFVFESLRKLVDETSSIQQIGLVDQQKDGRLRLPRYDAWILVTAGHTQQELDSLFEEIDGKIEAINQHESTTFHSHGLVLEAVTEDPTALRSSDYTF